MSDYRNTRYCSELKDIEVKKQQLAVIIKNEHPRAMDLHNFISPQKYCYKDCFMKIYNFKCCYCGVSIKLVNKSDFEIDHFICQTSSKFATKADAGNIENLVLACHTCNHNKGSFEIPDDKYDDLHPDMDKIKKAFVRDEDYYIRVSDDKSNDEVINSFYKKLNLSAEFHRIDFLLMNMIGLHQSVEINSDVCRLLGIAIEKLREKRNLMGS
ncbi:MAG: HNH endonuclease [Clostridia bacterium]|nr:HNH endonuclease [Clostridia bacterium]MBO5435814.1 HNH endonuclease [bacterium]